MKKGNNDECALIVNPTQTRTEGRSSLQTPLHYIGIHQNSLLG
jgi:hypothetical protein